MKEMQELALAVKSVTNTGFIQLKPLHSLIREEWLVWVYFRRLASVSARTAVCSGLISGVIPLSPSPSCQSPGLGVTEALPSARSHSGQQEMSQGLGLLTSPLQEAASRPRRECYSFLIYSSPHIPTPRDVSFRLYGLPNWEDAGESTIQRHCLCLVLTPEPRCTQLLWAQSCQRLCCHSASSKRGSFSLNMRSGWRLSHPFHWHQTSQSVACTALAWVLSIRCRIRLNCHWLYYRTKEWSLLNLAYPQWSALWTERNKEPSHLSHKSQ